MDLAFFTAILSIANLQSIFLKYLLISLVPLGEKERDGESSVLTNLEFFVAIW